MSGISTILFDVDGTLVDSVPFLVDCFCCAVREVFAREVDPAVVRPMVGLPLVTMFERIHPEIDAEAIERCHEAYRQSYLPTAVARSPLFDDALAVLEELRRRGIRMGVVSGKTLVGVRRVLEPSGALRYFDALVGADSGYAAKPSPEAALGAAGLLEGLPAETLVVGDSLLDVEMGAAAGMRTCGVTTGVYGRADLEGPADAVIERLSELPALLGPRAVVVG